MEVGGARGRCNSKLLAQAIRDGRYPHAVLLGEDICDQNGPMVSPANSWRSTGRRELEYAIEPLLEVRMPARLALRR